MALYRIRLLTPEILQYDKTNFVDKGKHALETFQVSFHRFVFY